MEQRPKGGAGARGDATTPAPPNVATLTRGARTPALGSWIPAAPAARDHGLSAERWPGRPGAGAAPTPAPAPAPARGARGS